MMHRIAPTFLLLALAAPACTTADDGVASQTENHTSVGLDFLPVLTFGESVTGQVASPQLDLWAIDLEAGDQIRLQETITSGDLAPDVVLFRGGLGSKISSAAFEVGEGMLTKDYAIDSSGTYVVLVRGYQNEGAGSYTLTASCNGGPCAGETPPPKVIELDDREQQTCIRKARECAVTELPKYNGAVGLIRGRQVFDRCLAKQTVETPWEELPVSCANACDGDDGSYVCDGVVSILPWLADQAPACVDAWNGWVDECYERGEYVGDISAEMVYGGESVCVYGEVAFNGYPKDVEQTAVCGGPWADDSCEACYLGCHASTGAWLDDLDTICDERCECQPSDDFSY